MLTVIQPPTPLTSRPLGPTCFLAGSIEMGEAELWQDEVISHFWHNSRHGKQEGPPLTIFNPRRDDWDSSWEQTPDNPQFLEQVTWELDALELAEIAFFYFDPNTKSPITMMELGLAIGRDTPNNGQEIFVCCPEGFYKKGNVDIICSHNNVPMFKTLKDMLNYFIPNSYND